jgi:outer membrane immunogenic protein
MFVTPLGLIPAAAADTANAAPPTPSTVWSGFYIGANLGFQSAQSHFRGFEPAGGGYCFNGGFGFNGTCGPNNTQTANGVLGGLQIGYNFQNGMWVYGVEADIDLSSAKKTTHAGQANGYTFGSSTKTTGVEAFSTFRGRIGYQFTPSSFIYATGGLAVAKMRDKFNPADGGTGYSWSDTNWRAGVVIGGGVETKLSGMWSVKGEALYYDMGSKDHVMTENGGGSTFGLRDHMTGWIGRIGLNYAFH